VIALDVLPLRAQEDVDEGLDVEADAPGIIIQVQPSADGLPEA
jgi:hypothetical protein